MSLHCVPSWGVQSSPLPTLKPPLGANVDLVPWFDGEGKAVATEAAVAKDAVVPCAVLGEDEVEVAPDSEGGCTRVGSCSGPAAWEFSRAEDDEGSVNASSYARVPVAEEEGGGSASLDVSDTCDSIRRVPTMGSCERELSGSLTTSFFSLGDSFSSSWRSDTNNTTSSDDISSSSVFRSRNKRKETENEGRSNKKGASKSSSTKGSRCKANQSQRKRRERVDERMKKLQSLVPTNKRQSTEKDKEWVLDEVIEQVQKLQAQLHQQHQMMMMSTTMMMMMMPVMPMLQQQPHMPMMMMMPMQEGYTQNLAAALPGCVYMPTTTLSYPQIGHWQPMSSAVQESAHTRMAAPSFMHHHQQFPFTFQHGNFF